MRIENTKYYMNLTEPLRRLPGVVFGDEGFSYTSHNVAFILTRLSRNNYQIKSIADATFETNEFESEKAAIDFAINVIRLYKSQ